MEIHEYIKGSCDELCPVSEVNMRTKERILHFFEQHPPSSKESRTQSHICITEFSRSAAGMRTPRAVDLRTSEALKRTVEYLLDRILPDTRKPFWFVYEFIFDRLRSVRQEIVIQNLDMSNTIALLEPIVMFLAYSSYRLCEVPIGHYDPYVCNQHLQECLKKLLCCYDEVERIKISGELLANRHTLEALYITFNLGSMEAIARGFSLARDIKSKHGCLVLKCIKMSQLYHARYFYPVMQQLHRLPPIIAGVVSLKLQTMRRETLIHFSAGYHSKKMSVPLEWLCHILRYKSNTALLNDLQHYKCHVDTDQGCVIFNKALFDRNAIEIKPRQEMIINDLFADDTILVEMLLLKC